MQMEGQLLIEKLFEDLVLGKNQFSHHFSFWRIYAQDV